LIDVDRFTSADLDAVVMQATAYRRALDLSEQIPELLRGRAAALFFSEASTRTRLSFELAARRLGADTLVLDPSASSVTKGETFVDTVRNLDAIGFDYLVMRHHRAGAAAVAARHFGGSVLNAGDGWQAHPTQALLDLVTMHAALGDVRGRKVAIVGDILHSRVARSNAISLTTAGAHVWFCAPPHWLRGVGSLAVRQTSDLSEALDNADIVMALRVQKERMGAGALSVGAYIDGYQVTEERLERLAPDARFMHPGPINEGVEVTREVALGPRSLVMEQVRNGVPVRMAAMALIAAAQAGEATRDLSSSIR
jgi:aspartate carbamoyltransferase catalytic subunit